MWLAIELRSMLRIKVCRSKRIKKQKNNWSPIDDMLSEDVGRIARRRKVNVDSP